MRTHGIVLLIVAFVVLAPVVGHAQCSPGTPVQMRVSDQYGFTFPTEDLGPLGATAAALTICDGFEWGLFGGSISAARNGSTFDLSLDWSLTGALQSVLSHMEDGHIHVDPASLLYPDCSVKWRAPDSLVSVHGNASLYTFAIGSTGGLFGAGIQHIQTGNISVDYCDDVSIFSPVATTIEQTVHLAGSMFASNASLGEPDSTYAIVQGIVSGNVLGVPISRSASADSHTDLVAQTDLDDSHTVPIALVPGENHFTTSAHMEFTLRVSAKSQGFAGTISGAATGGVNFPNTISVLNFRAAGGGPLPTGIRIVSRNTGQVYTAASAVSVDEVNGRGPALELEAPWPNPAAGTMHSAYRLARGAVVSVDVWDLSGRRVRTLQPAAFAAPGLHEFAWDGRDARGAAAAPGLYLVRVAGGGMSETVRLARL